MTEKHLRYGDKYKPHDTFWGIGIENETYLQIESGIVKQAESLLKNRTRERYSVEYWSTYKKDVVDAVLSKWISSLPDGPATNVNFPLLMNAHAFINTDIFGEPKTTYSKNPAPNPKYAGKSLYELCVDYDSEIFKTGKELWWTFDGDTIEFMTQNFYNAKMEDVVDELRAAKTRFLNSINGVLNSTQSKADYFQCVKYPPRNHGFAVYTTNRNNIGVFNNGTYHFNITLPTQLDADAKIADYKLFEMQHRNAARLFQWLSPFLIAKYGSGDIFNYYFGDSRFPNCSQRLAASRYISVGKYDTEKMPRGKILTVPHTENKDWHSIIYDSDTIAYNRLPNIGLDINYNKHWNHGLEFRIFDWFPETHLEECLRLLIWMCDESLSRAEFEDPRHDSTYNHFVSKVIMNGQKSILTAEEALVFSEVFSVDLASGSSILDALVKIYVAWKQRWNNSIDSCTSRMIRCPI
jgi:hypothetical protein